MMKTTRYNARRKIVLLRERIEFIPRPKRTDLCIVRLGKKHFCRVISSAILSTGEPTHACPVRKLVFFFSSRM